MEMPKYLVEIILVVNAESADEAKRIANYILDLPIPDKEVENAIESLRYEEIVEVKSPRD
jgi:hypothetical protein